MDASAACAGAAASSMASITYSASTPKAKSSPDGSPSISTDTGNEVTDDETADVETTDEDVSRPVSHRVSWYVSRNVSHAVVREVSMASSVARCASDSNDPMADSIGASLAGRPRPGLAPALTNGPFINVATLVLIYAAQEANVIWHSAIPSARNRASSTSANNPCTKVSSFKGRVTDEYRTGTPSRRSRSPNSRTAALSWVMTAMSFHRICRSRCARLMRQTTSSSSSREDRYRPAVTVPSA